MELDPLRMTVPPNSNLEIVQIGAVTGKYVEGGWHHPDGCCYAWDSEPYFKTLRWWVNGQAFELSYMGMDIEKEDMIKIAESIK